MPGKGKQPLDAIKNRYGFTRGIQVGTVLACADNSGAKMLKTIGVKGVSGRLNRLPAAGPGDVIVASVVKGRSDMRKKIVLAVIIRQKQMIRRKDGVRLQFEESAAVIISNKGDLKGTQISGPVLREVCDIWPKISSQAGSIY
ncbi:Ribosomal protein L23 [Spraguea lophii 42_110]|uniref:Ribosomal protein L23 n=1 Tax=Spraguea lophii (strain 42_110) TaxID=1358809 RepID=S7XLC4_SPRLO|nr:Chain LV0, Ribosomal protein L23 [Spraguea lophii 42_110]7QJH_KV0 Chain KV0, Ribosomal protein L23 [Spraguea lophii 42_110]7QJH_LV0 Chain LV0, Ribosomal protein L23 [Spraguea lophii 42_110]8BR3_LV0 Chain LV0, Ribosomal protein L23 [Spraguea lophii 42_110]8P5D_LV0 Chain LV0, Ribosomal protein L23 [Spraguea lophii 42_110]8P60_KV0 Chain KV0, Ribosomal protein L23 [Spraguea lophii 42_110]8P60_LV0 Chain LV0, Ribosomal protein L23 [Spraguea lophii 42_110]EPR79879.1 Ribosomal protein L23 [Spragu